MSNVQHADSPLFFRRFREVRIDRGGETKLQAASSRSIGISHVLVDYFAETLRLRSRELFERYETLAKVRRI